MLGGRGTRFLPVHCFQRRFSSHGTTRSGMPLGMVALPPGIRVLYPFDRRHLLQNWHLVALMAMPACKGVRAFRQLKPCWGTAAAPTCPCT